MITLAGFVFLPSTRAFYSSIFLRRQFRKVHSAIAKYVEHRTYLQSVSYEDSRLQNYLKDLKGQYSNAVPRSNSLYDKVSLENIISLTKDIDILNSEIKELDTFILELKEKNDEMVATANAEKEELEDKLSSLKTAVLEYLIPDQIIDDKDIIMELTPGVGGQEAMLFTKDMFHMYCNFARWKNWSCEIVKYDGTDIGGVRNAHIALSGKNAFKILKYECGVHRVQRIPKTEKAGRIHTSTMTVAVLPQPSEIDITINPKDLEIEFKRSGGAGGQHVNTTDSCVRLYHKPTGLIVESQAERDQHRNKILAMKSLRAKLYEIELESRKKETTLNRKLQVGSAGRSEKVRTYNFVQDRITDHRAHISVFDIDLFFKGEEHLNNLIEQLQEWDSINILMQLLEKYNSSKR